MSAIGFVDNALVVCVAEDVGIFKVKINESLWREKRWLESRGLKMAPEKSEALLVTERRFFQYPKIVLVLHEVVWKKSVKYLRVQLDQRLSFGEHLQIATAKAIQCVFQPYELLLQQYFWWTVKYILLNYLKTFSYIHVAHKSQEFLSVNDVNRKPYCSKSSQMASAIDVFIAPKDLMWFVYPIYLLL